MHGKFYFNANILYRKHAAEQVPKIRYQIKQFIRGFITLLKITKWMCAQNRQRCTNAIYADKLSNDWLAISVPVPFLIPLQLFSDQTIANCRYYSCHVTLNNCDFCAGFGYSYSRMILLSFIGNVQIKRLFLTRTKFPFS